MPASVEWTRRVSVFDQGALGSCTGNAAAGWLGTDNKLRQGLTEFKDSNGLVSMLDEADAIAIYSAATLVDPYAGTYPPNDTGSDGLSVAKVLKSLGYIDVYTHGFSIIDVQSAIQSSPVLLGTNWYEGMFNPAIDGVVSISGAVAGGHEYLLVGYDVGDLGWPAPYKLCNSWGTGWGDLGFFYYTEATLTRLLSESGDCTVPHALVSVTPPPPPPPPPAPTPPSNWWTQLWDRIYHWLGWD